MNVTIKLISIVASTVIFIFGAWLFIEQRIDEKVDKETFELRLEMKQLRMDSMETILEEKLKIVKENQAKILEKLEVRNDR